MDQSAFATEATLIAIDGCTCQATYCAIWASDANRGKLDCLPTTLRPEEVGPTPRGDRFFAVFAPVFRVSPLRSVGCHVQPT